MSSINSYFVQAYCARNSQKFYLRYDKSFSGQWVLTYGLKEKPEDCSNRNGDDRSGQGNDELDISQARTGVQYKCPYCGNQSFVRCGRCKALTCKPSYEKTFICANCGHSGTVNGTIKELKVNRTKGQ